MAALDPSLYSAGIAILVILLCLFRTLHLENFFSSKHGTALPAWLSGVVVKGAGEQELDAVSAVHPKDVSSIPKHSSDWWTDEKQFQLERRAIFSKTWLFVCHTSRFQKPGDYRTFEVAGFSFLVIFGKDKQLRAFHNVCRHRAYAVTKKESGSSTVLGCRYHGWSYDTKGKLIKAPEFENVAGFSKEMNGLWELKTEVRCTMVFVNFEAGNDDAGIDLQEAQKVMNRWNVGDMKWAHEWKIEGKFNWKLAASEGLLDIAKQKSTPYWEQFLPSRFRSPIQQLELYHSTILHQLPSGRLLTIRLLPRSANATTVECNIYGRTSIHTKATQMELDSTKAEIQWEIKQIELKQREILDGEEFQNAEQDELHKILERHETAERTLGAEIHPAARKKAFTEEGTADDDCRHLTLQNNTNTDEVWHDSMQRAREEFTGSGCSLWGKYKRPSRLVILS